MYELRLMGLDKGFGSQSAEVLGFSSKLSGQFGYDFELCSPPVCIVGNKEPEIWMVHLQKLKPIISISQKGISFLRFINFIRIPNGKFEFIESKSKGRQW